MNALKVSMNGEHIATIEYESLTDLNAGVFCLDGEPNLVIQGSKVTAEISEDFVWHDHPIRDATSISIELVDSQSSHEPISTQKNKINKDEKCLFCYKAVPNSMKLFKGKHALAKICNECITKASLE